MDKIFLDFYILGNSCNFPGSFCPNAANSLPFQQKKEMYSIAPSTTTHYAVYNLLVCRVQVRTHLFHLVNFCNGERYDVDDKQELRHSWHSFLLQHSNISKHQQKHDVGELKHETT